MEHIKAAIEFCKLVRSTLGPAGMNKMVVSNNTILTNDGATIVNSLKGGDPIVELFKNLAKTQEKVIGDGTTTSLILAGQLLENGQYLMEKGIHPTIIIKGYNLANVQSMKFLDEAREKSRIEDIMRTCFGTKISSSLIDHLINLLRNVDFENLKLFKTEGNPMDSEIYNGTVFEGHTLNDRMENDVVGKIALMDFPINLDVDKFQVTNANELEKITELNKRKKRQIVDVLVENDVKCLFYTDTTPEFESYLTDKGIVGIVVFRRENIDNIARVVKGKVCSGVEDIPSHLGHGKVKYKKPGVIYVASDSDIKTLILKGSGQTLEESERAIQDVFGLMKIEKDSVIGAGAIEIEISNHLRSFAQEVGGKEQLAVEKFAEALESIPLIIAENCGLDAIEVLTFLKSRHAKGEKDLGVDPILSISNARDRNIFEPVLVKIHAISSAVNTANLILKTDKFLQGEN